LVSPLASSTTTTAQALVDRGVECARLDQLLADARTGTSAAVVVRGEAGVGKSALLGYLLEYSHRVITGGIGHNLPQEAPQAFAQAILDVGLMSEE
jgi:pimeloyl-ACP methyl ester carboxylesterase